MYILRRERMSKYTKTVFIHIPEDNDEDTLYNIYAKFWPNVIFATAPTIDWRGNKNKRIQIEAAVDLTPKDFFVNKSRRYHYVDSDLCSGVEFQIDGVGTCSPAKIAGELTEKEWTALFNLWKRYEDPKGMTKTQKINIPEYLKMIEIMKTDEFKDSVMIHDIIV